MSETREEFIKREMHNRALKCSGQIPNPDLIRCENPPTVVFQVAGSLDGSRGNAYTGLAVVSACAEHEPQRRIIHGVGKPWPIVHEFPAAEVL